MEKKGAVVVDTKMDYNKIQKDFKRMTDDTKKLIDKYNKSVTSIKSQGLAIDKAKNKLTELQEKSKTPILEETKKNIKESTNKLIDLNKKLIETEKTIQEINTRGVLTEGKDIYGNVSRYKTFSPEDEQIRATSLKEKSNINAEIIQTKEKIEELKVQYESLNQVDPKLKNSIEETKNKLQLMNEKLYETKNVANQQKIAIEEAVGRDKTEPLRNGLDKTGKAFSGAGKLAKNFTKSVGKTSLNSVSKQIKDIGSRLDKFKNKMTRLIGTAMVFSLIRSSLTKLRDGLLSMLKTNDVFKTNLAQIKGNLLTAFAPIYNAVLPAINSLMNALNRASAAFANFIVSIFGTNLKSATNDAKKLAGALNDTAKSGDNVSGSLSKIDKLDVIGNDSSSGNGNSNDIDYSGLNNANSVLFDTLNKLKELISNGDWGGLARYIGNGFVNAFNWLADKIKNIDWKRIGKNISEFITNIDWSGLLVGLVSIFGEAVLGLQELILNIDWATALSNFSIGLRDAIFKISDYMSQIKWSELGKKISDTITSIDWAGIGNSIITTLWNTLKGIGNLLSNIDWGAVGKKLSDTIHSWATTMREQFSQINWGEVGKKIVDAIWNFVSNIDWGQLGIDLLTNMITGLVGMIDLVVGVFKELFNKILEFFGIHSPSTAFLEVGKNIMLGLWEGIRGLIDFVLSLFSDMFNGICNIFGAIGSWFNNNVFTPIKNVFNNIWNSLISGAQSAWTGIKNVFSTVATFFKNIFSNAWTAVKNVFSTGGKIFDGIKDGIVSTFKTIVNAIIRGINKVVSVPFNGINSVLSKIKGIEIFGLSPFKNLIKTISVPQIPELAKGAVIPPRQRFAAILGDQKHGTNIEAPLETIKQANREVLTEFFDKLGALTEQVREIVFKNFTIVAQFGNRDFRQVVYEAIRLTEQELGKPLFVS